MTFRVLHERLIDDLRERVRRGETTERGLARASGISQPHLHNVLKGKRELSPAMADAVLKQLDMDLLDLIDLEEWLAARGRQSP